MNGTNLKDPSNVQPLPAAIIGNDRNGRRLDSWKEIATYLGRSPRCAQRWERNLGLPVHRIHHLEGYTVYAYVSELDSWRERRDRTPASCVAESVQPARAHQQERDVSEPQSRWSTSMIGLFRLFLKAVPLRISRS